MAPMGSGPLLPGATRMEGPVSLAPRPPSSRASSSSSSPRGAGLSVSSPGSPPAPQGEHPSPPGFRAVLFDTRGTGRRSGDRSRLCTWSSGRLWVPPPRGEGVCASQVAVGQGAQCKPGVSQPVQQHKSPGSSTTPPLLPIPVCSRPDPCVQDRTPSQGKGYNHVQGQHAQAAHEPGQVVQDVITLGLARLRVLQEDTEAVQGIPQHHQGKEGVRDPAGGFPLVLGKEGEERSLAAALLNLSTT